VKKLAITAAAAIALAVAGAWRLSREDPAPPAAEAEPVREERAIGLEAPLPLDETVELRWVDEASGAGDAWQVTKREVAPGDLEAGTSLPEPDPDAGDHMPDESARTLHAMGLESWKRGEIRAAIAQLRQAVETDPEDPEIQTHYGRLQLLAMDYAEAEPHLERAVALSPDDPQVWLDLASLYQKGGDVLRAAQARARAAELAGDRPIRQDERSGLLVVDGVNIYP